jgi:ABC-type transport system involved in multi-copper enzyme maturation permease subunit
VAFGPILWRELITASRRSAIYRNRTSVALLATALLVGNLMTWDWVGRDRTSVQGSYWFALTTFGLIVAAQAAFTLGVIPSEVAPGIARERDRKTLDALLATELSSAEIVLGAMAAGLVKYATNLGSVLPFFALLIVLGGVDPRLVLAAATGLASTAFALAALSVAVSVSARTARRAVSFTALLMMLWYFAPFFCILLLPRLWPAAGPWVSPIALPLLDSSPVAVVVSFVPLLGRSTPAQALVWMIGYQLIAGVALILWASYRLRPASRAVYDVEGKASFLRSLRTRRRSRPACGDDPVLWNEIYSTRGFTEAERIFSLAINGILIGLLLYVMSWFAFPAFAELAERGYGASRGTPATLAMNPLARELVNRTGRIGISAEPGLARLEFNVVLGQITAVLELFYVLLLASAAAESIASEKERDTWLGLLATPLTGREILRAKILGPFRRVAALTVLIVGLWTVGLLAGSVHPLGYLAALVELAVSAWFFVALGVRASLWGRDRSQATERTIGPVLLLIISGLLPFLVPSAVSSVLWGVGSMPFLTWLSLVSYEDVLAATRIGAYSLDRQGLGSGEGPVKVVATCVLGLSAHAFAAFYLTRAALRGFDAAVGRPIRSRVEVQEERGAAVDRRPMQPIAEAV